MAKQDQQVLMAQKTSLEKDLGRARITDFKEASTAQISVGTIVEVKSEASGKTSRYTLLGAWDGDPDNAILSYKTPFGAALLGKKVGDSIKVKTGVSEDGYQVVSIARYVDTLPAS
jgi:transcription elongation GreA/GreB family factor